MDRPINSKLTACHCRHEEEKLRAQEKAENLVFRLADESIPASECDVAEEVKELPPVYKKFDYPVNESELRELKLQLNGKSLDEIKRHKLLATSDNANDDGKEIGISCGQKLANRVILRSFHDRICDEPRGETNYHHLQRSGKEGREATCQTHKQWLDAMANDPEIVREPPRAKLLSTVKTEREPNDDRMFLFEDTTVRRKNVATVSPIRQHIEQIDEKLKTQMSQARVKSQTNVNNDENRDEKRNRRVKFMGIPTAAESRSHAGLKEIVAKISQASMLSHGISSDGNINNSTSKRKQSKGKISPGELKRIPRVPELDCTMEEERRVHGEVDKFVPFTKAQPRGINPKNLRVDKSLPWVHDILREARLKKDFDGKSFVRETSAIGENDAVQLHTHDDDTNENSDLKKVYKEIIAGKLGNYKADTKELQSSQDDKDNADGEIQSNTQSTSSLSSSRTYFFNGTKSEINLHKKFQNCRLAATKAEQKLEDQPFFISQLGQFKVIQDLCKPKDRFHTYRTRSCADIRDRIKVESPAYEDEMFGKGKLKFRSKFATDIDESYQADIYNERSGTNLRFKPITEMIKLRHTLRKKMDIHWIKERMVLDELDALKQEAVMEQATASINEYDNFLDEGKEKSYRRSVQVMKEVKVLYQETDRLRKLRESLETEVEPLKMKIFNIGIDFVRLTIMQNFQYLLKPDEWRKQFDYLHRTPDGQIEGFKESILQRNTANLWDRNAVTVYTIKSFIEEIYMKRNYQLPPAFDCGEALLVAIKEIQSKSYRSLLQFHLIGHTMTETEREFIEVTKANDNFVGNLTRFNDILSRRRIFMERRSLLNKELAKKIIDKPMEESFSDEKLHTVKALCDMMFNEVVLTNNDTSMNSFSYVEKVAAVEKKVFGIFEKLDELPRNIITEIEGELRANRAKKLREAEKAQRIEVELQYRFVQFKRCLAKPHKKVKREGKLPRSELPKKPPPVEVIKPLLSPIEEEYIRAFTELGSDEEIKFDEKAREMIDRIKYESIPFYLDHLLDKIGVKIAKETEEKAERILLDEAQNFKFKDVLPSIRTQVKLWQQLRDKSKQENIRKTPYLYQ